MRHIGCLALTCLIGVLSPVAHADISAEMAQDRKSTRLNSSHGYTSYAVFCLTKKQSPGCIAQRAYVSNALSSPMAPRTRRQQVHAPPAVSPLLCRSASLFDYPAPRRPRSANL